MAYTKKVWKMRQKREMNGERKADNSCGPHTGAAAFSHYAILKAQVDFIEIIQHVLSA